jgi:uncharacterized membrane protein YfcA
MDLLTLAAMLAGGVLAGAISAVAGGASFLTFPMLLATGMAPMAASITNWVALTPGNFMALFAYRRELGQLRDAQGATGPSLWAQMLVAFAGGAAGAALLLYTPEARFEQAVPWLMLGATLIFALGDWMRRRLLASGQTMRRPAGGVLLACEFILMVYGGYFGSGLGIMLLALLTILGEASIHRANAHKNLLNAVLSVSVVGIYLNSGQVQWRYGLPLFAGGLLGGYLGVRLSRRVPDRIIRLAVLLWAGVLTGIMFWKYG